MAAGTMRRASFWVDGVPVPQGSVSALGGHIVSVTPGLRAWREAVKQAATETPWGSLGAIDAPCGLSVHFYFPSPKNPRWRVPAVAPDGDKLLRAVQDALTATPERRKRGKRGGIIPATPGLVTNDARFVRGTYVKDYGGPGAQIYVWELDLL